MALSEEGERRLHEQLVRLGDMMGDGLHHDSDGKWIEKEYKRVCRALGIGKAPRKSSEEINKQVAEFLIGKTCPCSGELAQTRSGAYRLVCKLCKKKFQIKRRKVSK